MNKKLKEYSLSGMLLWSSISSGIIGFDRYLDGREAYKDRQETKIENNEKESKTYLFRANLDVAIALCLAGLGFKELPRRKEEDISKLLK